MTLALQSPPRNVHIWVDGEILDKVDIKIWQLILYHSRARYDFSIFKGKFQGEGGSIPEGPNETSLTHDPELSYSYGSPITVAELANLICSTLNHPAAALKISTGDVLPPIPKRFTTSVELAQFTTRLDKAQITFGERNQPNATWIRPNNEWKQERYEFAYETALPSWSRPSQPPPLPIKPIKQGGMARPFLPASPPVFFE